MKFSTASILFACGLAALSLPTASATPIPATLTDLSARGSAGVDWEAIRFEQRSSDVAPASELDKRIVVSPRITYPTADTKLIAGQESYATWDTSEIPEEAKDYKGKLMLGYEPASGEGGLNLRVDLADNFLLTSGHVGYTLPSNLTTRDDYILVLFGDSGNTSPHFTITAAQTECSSTAPAKAGGALINVAASL